MRLRLALGFMLLSSAALAQSGVAVKQSGNVTPNQVPWWVTSGVIGGGVTSADSPISSFGVTNNGFNGICSNSDRITAAGRNTICIGSKTNGPSQITVQNYGTATPQPFQFVINGTTITPAGGITALTVGATTIGSGTNQALLYNNNGILGNTLTLPPSFTVPTNQVTYVNPFISAVQVTQTQYNNQEIWATTFDQIDATGAVDSGLGIRGMTGGNLPGGAVIRFPKGTFLLDSCVNDDAFGLTQSSVRNNPVSIVGSSANTGTAGNEGGTIFLLGPNLPATCNPLTTAGTGNIFGRRFENFSMLPASGAKGTNAIYINGTGQPDYFEYNFAIRNVNIGNMLNGQSFKTFASPSVTVTATVSTTNMTITGASPNTIFPGALIASGLTTGTKVVSQTSGTTGGNGVYVINNSQTFGPGSVLILGNNGGGALNNSVIENSILMSVNMNNVGDSIMFFNDVLGQGETRGDPGYVWDQVGGATSIKICGGQITNANGSVIVNGGINPWFGCALALENGLANAHGSMIDISGATSKVFGGSMESVTVSQNNGTGTIFPVRVDNSEGFSVGPNNRLATQSGGGQHISVTVNAVNPLTNGNYCTTSGVVADCLVSNASALINFTKLNLGFVNGTDLFSVGGFITVSGLHMPNSNNIFTFLPPPSGLGNFRFPVGTAVDMVSTGGTGQVLQQASFGGALTVGTVSITVNGTTCTTGSTCTPTATATNALTFGTHLTSGGSSYNGSAAVTITSDATAVNTASTIMARDGSGQVAATTFTGALTGNATTATTASAVAVGGITGLGTGVATALAVNIGTAGSFVVNGGALGSPSSAGTLPAHSLSGTISGGGNQINNVIIGTTTPLAGSFTTLSASTSLTSPLHIGGSGTTGTQLTLQTTSGVGTTDQMVVNGGNAGATRVATFLGTGITGFGSASGAASPSNTIVEISANTTANSGTVTAYTTMLHVTSADNVNGSITSDAFGTGIPAINMRQANGTAASKTATANDAFIFVLNGDGYNGSSYNFGTQITAAASQTWTAGANGTRLAFSTIPNGSTTLGEAMRIQNSGGVSIGTTTDPGIGSLQVNATVVAPNLTSDAGLTDTTLCWKNTATTGTFLKGSGTLGICLGTSGAQFKTAFAPMVGGLYEITKLHFQNYRYKNGFVDSGERMQYGLTAQDVEIVLPDLVRHDEMGEAVNYDAGALLFIGLRAIQQLKVDNDNLRAEILSVKQR